MGLEVGYSTETLLTCLDACRGTGYALTDTVLRHHRGRVLQATRQTFEVTRSIKVAAGVCKGSVHAYCIYSIKLTTRAAYPPHTRHIISAAQSGIEAWWLAWCCTCKRKKQGTFIFIYYDI